MNTVWSSLVRVLCKKRERERAIYILPLIFQSNERGTRTMMDCPVKVGRGVCNFQVLWTTNFPRPFPVPMLSITGSAKPQGPWQIEQPHPLPLSLSRLSLTWIRRNALWETSPKPTLQSSLDGLVHRGCRIQGLLRKRPPGPPFSCHSLKLRQTQ